MSELLVDAPIVAVAVYPDRARITRRGRITVPAGDQAVYVEPLPLVLEQDSIRVTGRGPATVLGVDVTTRREAVSNDELVEAIGGRAASRDRRPDGLTSQDADEERPPGL